MEAPKSKSYLDLLEGQAGIKERIEEIRIGNIAAEMRVYTRRARIPLPSMSGVIDDAGELSFYSKDLLTNKRKEIMLNFDTVVDSVRVLRDRMQSGEWDDEFALESEGYSPIYVNTYSDDSVVIMSGRVAVEVDKALFLRLIEEYVEMIENRESGKVTVYSGREVVKEITS